MRRDIPLLILLSALILYLEVLLIRWIGTEVNIFAYLQNAVLICCFLGLGLGCLVPRKVSISRSLVPLVILVACLSIPSSAQMLGELSRMLSLLHDFVVWDQLQPMNRMSQVRFAFLGAVLTLLLAWLIWQISLPLGQRLGDLMSSAERPLVAYSANIFGSLLGIWLFTLLGFLSLNPCVWFVVLGLLYLPFVVQETKAPRFSAVLLALVVLIPFFPYFYSASIETRWSPYQKLVLLSTPHDQTEYEVKVNNTGFQQIQNNLPAHHQALPEKFPVSEEGLNLYDIPGTLYSDAKKILVVGAGTGNDVAGVLRTTNGDVTGVEIDPVILDFGKRFHPEKPYDSPRVHTVVDDARSFFFATKERYDLIVFGLLDSHTTPTLTNARLDHFVYTEQSLAHARSLLNPGGVLALIFQEQRPFIVKRLALSLRGAFGEAPLVFTLDPNASAWGGTMFIAGDRARVDAAIGASPRLEKFVEERKVDWEKLGGPDIHPTTDNWPYLYLEKPSVPTLFYLLGIILICLWFLSQRDFGSEGRLSFKKWFSHFEFFGLGAAFSLLEVFGISQAAVLFGSTWLVNSIVITGILVMILVANYIAICVPRAPRWLWYLGLLAVSAGIYAVDVSLLMNLSYTSRILAVALLSGLPMMFSGVIFAQAFTAAEARHEALGINLLGALLGGVLQLTSFLLGIKSLLLLSILFYLCAFVHFLVLGAPRHRDSGN